MKCGELMIVYSKSLIIFVANILFTILTINAFGGSRSEKLFDRPTMTSDELLSLAQTYSKNTETIDSAIITLSVLVERYSPNLSKDEKYKIIKAYEALWEIYFFNFFDYVKASDYLNHALILCDELEYDKSNIYLSIGMMDHSLEDSSPTEDLLPEAKRYYILAIEEAARNRNYNVAAVALMNLIGIAKQLNQLPEIESQLELVHKLISQSDSPKTAKLNYYYAQNLYEALKNMSQGKYSLSVNKLSSMLDSVRNEKRENNKEAEANILFMRSEAYTRSGDVGAGIKDLLEIKDISNTPERCDIKMSALRRLIDNYKLEGNIDEAMKLKMEYFSLKDSVLNFRQLASVNELRVLERMHAMDKEIVMVKQRNKITTIIVVVVIIVVIVISVAFYILRKEKIVISNAYHELYRKNVELLQTEEIHLKQKKLWEEEKERYDSLLNSISTTPTSQVKYYGSALDEKTKIILMNKVTELMNDESVICSMEFSSERLSQLVGVPYKYLSQVINEIYGDNFNALVNTYRVKVACKIMGSDKGQNMTVEGIANAVGFKSRSAFGRVFKSISGLSPSDYIKMAKQERHINNNKDDSNQDKVQ